MATSNFFMLPTVFVEKMTFIEAGEFAGFIVGGTTTHPKARGSKPPSPICY